MAVCLRVQGRPALLGISHASPPLPCIRPLGSGLRIRLQGTFKGTLTYKSTQCPGPLMWQSQPGHASSALRRLTREEFRRTLREPPGPRSMELGCLSVGAEQGVCQATILKANMPATCIEFKKDRQRVKDMHITCTCNCICRRAGPNTDTLGTHSW